MDLSKLNIPDTADIHIEFPATGKLYADEEKKMPSIITVYSPASDEIVSFRRKLNKRANELIARGGVKAFSKRSPEDNEDDRIERLVAFTAGVKNITYKGIEITKDNIEDVYRDPKMGWVVTQVEEKISGWEDFLT